MEELVMTNELKAEVGVEKPNLDDHALDLIVYALRTQLANIEVEYKRNKDVADIALRVAIDRTISERKSFLNHLFVQVNERVRGRREAQQKAAQEEYERQRVIEARKILDEIGE